MPAFKGERSVIRRGGTIKLVRWKPCIERGETGKDALDNPDHYIDEVLWPDKVRLNREYVESWSFWGDIRLIMKTISRSADYSD